MWNHIGTQYNQPEYQVIIIDLQLKHKMKNKLQHKYKMNLEIGYPPTNKMYSPHYIT